MKLFWGLKTFPRTPFSKEIREQDTISFLTYTSVVVLPSFIAHLPPARGPGPAKGSVDDFCIDT